jgi:hypothetical protein
MKCSNLVLKVYINKHFNIKSHTTTIHSFFDWVSYYKITQNDKCQKDHLVNLNLQAQ